MKIGFIDSLSCYRDTENVIRIISARKATKSEANQYGGVR